MSIKAFKYRLSANKATTKKLHWVLDRARELYNAALTERRDAYEVHVKRHPGYYDEKTRKQLTRELTVDYYGQKRDLVDVKGLRPEYGDIASHVLQDVIMRVKRTYDRFFDRVKNGQKPGYPRFKGRNQYDSFSYPDHAGWKFTDLGSDGGKKHKGTLHRSLIGTVKVKMHREMQGKIKTLMVKREGEQWYCIFTSEVEVTALPVAYEDVGIDLGVTHLASLSNGEFIDHPRHFRQAEKKLAEEPHCYPRLCLEKPINAHDAWQKPKSVALIHQRVPCSTSYTNIFG